MAHIVSSIIWFLLGSCMVHFNTFNFMHMAKYKVERPFTLYMAGKTKLTSYKSCFLKSEFSLHTENSERKKSGSYLLKILPVILFQEHF